MKIKWGAVRRFVFGLPLINIETTWRNVPNLETEARQHLRKSVVAFITGYNTGLEVSLSNLLIAQLDGFNDNLRGFAYEGAGMGLAVIDYARNKGKLQEFLNGSGANYLELVHVGAGCATAALKKDLNQALAKASPMQRWWIVDGYGFFCGIYKWEDSVEKQVVPTQVQGYARRGFDRGLGRRIWFALSADVKSVAKLIQTFPESRQGDLWSGIGIASTFAGGVDEKALVDLKNLAGDCASYLALGSALAAKCRYNGNNIVDYTNIACSVLCGMSAEEAAKMTDEVMEGLTIDEKEPIRTEKPIFETLREGIRSQLMKVPVVA